MNDKKRSKIQGAWAGTSSRPLRSNKDADPPNKKYFFPTNDIINGNNQNVNTPLGSFKHSFKYENVELKKEPTSRTIDKPGDYIISDVPNGKSKVVLITNFIEANECKWMLKQLKDELNWKQQHVHKKGISYLQPRMTAWIGNVPYSYSGVTHQQHQIWSPLMTMLKDTIENKTGRQYNSVLANLYRDGHDHIPWHCDDEEEFGSHPSIASLSFGDTRMFELRRKPFGEHLLELKANEPTDADYLEYIKIPLDAGSLLLMEGAVQLDWQHRVAREYHDRGQRINLTFRYTVK